MNKKKIEEMIEQLDISDTYKLQEALKFLINFTYVVEDEYKSLTKAYDDLKNRVLSIIADSPNPIWVLNEDNSIFLRNSQAEKISDLFDRIDLNKTNYEVLYNDCRYLINIRKELDKTIIASVDITTQMREERLISMGQMAAQLAHDIRNPIGSVALLTSTLLKKADVKNKPLVFEIKKAIFRVERIIEAKLLFSKDLKVNKQHFNLNNLIEDMDTSIGYYSYSKDINFKFNLPEKTIFADFSLLAIVFQNFIFNGIDAIEDLEDIEIGTIEIIYKEDSKNHIFKIFDTGIPIEDKSILFEAFKTTKTKGNGLGLALSLQIIQAHNGTINVIDEVKGFEILIPI